MPTFNRAPNHLHLLEEAVECFIRQDWPHKELIIGNDTPGQNIYLDVPRMDVRVINYPNRFASLSAKLQDMIGHATGDCMCRWDDDDINLPHRLSYSMGRLTALNRREALSEWRAANYLYCPNGGRAQEVQTPGNTHVMSLWHKEVLESIGGYPSGLSGCEDQRFNQMLVMRNIGRMERVPTSHIYYFYRWGVAPSHLSGVRDSNADNPHQCHWDQRGNEPIKMGNFYLKPQWKYDYPALLAGFAKGQHFSIS